MTWKYRIIRHVSTENRQSFRIHEVYYEGEKIVTVSEGPAIPSGESVYDLEEDMRSMLEAFKKPVLDYSNI